MKPVVFDTGVVVSGLLFPSESATRLRGVWRSATFDTVVSAATLEELVRVLGYPKFRLTASEIESLLSDFLPCTRLVRVDPDCGDSLPRCRDLEDQKFLDLAATSKASALVTGDRDLLDLAGQVTRFEILTPARFLERLVARG